MAAGREAASAAAIEVILDGYFFLGAGEEGDQGRIREQWTLETSKVGGVFGVLPCVKSPPYHFAPVWHFFTSVSVVFT